MCKNDVFGKSSSKNFSFKIVFLYDKNYLRLVSAFRNEYMEKLPRLITFIGLHVECLH